MRLTPTQVQLTKQTVAHVLGMEHRLWLFGSRADDDRRGGDLDLLIADDRLPTLLQKARLNSRSKPRSPCPWIPGRSPRVEP